jgi:hypothetical protein
MSFDRDELLVFVRWGRLPRPPQPAPARRRWRPERRGPAPRRRREPQPAAPVCAQQLSPQEYLELEFAVGEQSRR